MTIRSFVLDIKGCARCHCDGHKDLVFSAFTYPSEIHMAGVENAKMTHWAICPNTREPILYASGDIPEFVEEEE